MDVILSSGASHDIESIRTYIAVDNPVAAQDVFSSLLTAMGRLGDMPNMGRPGRLPATRELIVPPYVIVYTVIERTVWIARILHGARQWP